MDTDIWLNDITIVTLGNMWKLLLSNIISKLCLKNWHFLVHDIMGLRKCKYRTAAEQPLL